MNVFITGGNGFVGLNIIKALVEAQHNVYAYIRANSNTKYLDPFGVTVIRGELHDQALLSKSMQGMDAVIHTAGNTSCNKSDIPLLHDVNVEGTRNVVNAAIAAGVKRFVFTSTTSTIGAKNSPAVLSSEHSPLSGFRAKNPYGISKINAEKIVLSAVDKGMEVIILNPAEVVGEFDYNFQWGRIVLAVFHNQLPFIPPGGGSFCHAKEVGRAHVQALTKGRSGEKYILAGMSVTFKEYIDCISRLLNKKFDAPKVSYKKLYWNAVAHEIMPGVFKEKPMVEAYRMRVFGGNYYFDCQKSIAELDFKVSALDEIVADCINWYKGHSII